VEAAKAIAATAPQMISTLDADEDILDAAAESEVEEDPEAGETFEGSNEGNIEEIGGHEDAPDDMHAGEAVEHAGAGSSPRDSERDGGRRRRRRGRGRGRGGEPREGGERENGGPRDSAQPYEPAPVQSIADGELNGAAPDSEPAPHHEGAPTNGEGGDTPEGRRRRRRGRRGGRRNRQRNGEAPPPFNPNEAAPDDVGFPPVSEQDASGFAPPFDNGANAPAPAAPSSYVATPEAKPAYAPVEPAPSQEPPRRRSTIREPAPIGASASVAAPAAPPPAPVISVTATSEPATPKRGWWGKRLLGDKD
jgi:ribonuclease E